MAELKPCVTCGKLPVVRLNENGLYDVVCKGHFETNYHKWEDLAIEIWNDLMDKESEE